MKFMHISDLHVGKRVNEFAMIEDQKYIFNQILDIAKDQGVDSILISGDVYDKTVPSAEAVDVFDDLITDISAKNMSVFVISGNHDSPERLNFGSRIMGKQKVYIASEYDGHIRKVTMEDEFGKLNIFLMPYLKPAIVNKKLSTETTSFDECVREALKVTDINLEERNILVSHQFVTSGGEAPVTSDSESKSLGGLDNVDVTAFEVFDYVALGHIHGPQKMGRATVRYSGSPLKYSFSECRHNKSVTIVDVKEKGNILIELIKLNPLHDMKEISCTLEQLQTGQTLQKVLKDDYIHITFTDEEEIIDAIGKVREIYPNVMILDFDNQRTKENINKSFLTGDDVRQKSPKELFDDFYVNQNNSDITDVQSKIFSDIIEKLEGKRYEA